MLAPFHSTIDQRITRQHDDQTGYSALLYLGEAGVANAVQLLANILLQRPLDNVPPTIGMQLLTLYSAKSSYQGILDPVREHLWKSPTKIGKASLAAKTPNK